MYICYCPLRDPNWNKILYCIVYSKKFTRDPLINRLLLCKNPRILQWDFQLYKYNIDVMEKIPLSVKCSFHFTTQRTNNDLQKH